MKRALLKLSPVCVASSLLLIGCSTTNTEIRENVAQIQHRYEEQVARRDQRISREEELVVEVNQPFLGSDDVDLSPEVEFPIAFTKAWSWHRDDLGKGMSLTGAAQLITRQFGVRVRIEPEVFLPASSMMLTNAKGASSTPAPTPTASATMPPLPFGVAPGGQTQAAANVRDYDTSVDMQISRNLFEWCENVASKLGISYRYDKKTNELTFYRFETGTFVFRVSPGVYKFGSSTGTNTNTSATSGGSSSASTSSVSGSNSSSSTATTGTDLSGDYSIWKDTLATVESMMTGGRKPVANQGANTLTVVDTPDTIRRVDKYVTKMNELLGRQAIFSIEYHRIALNRSSQFGVNANIVYTKLLNANPQRSISTTGAPSLVGVNAGSAAVNILNAANGAYSGSTLNLGFLNELGSSVDSFSQDVSVQNFRLAPMQAGRTKSYVPNTTPASGGAAGGTGVPGINTALAPSGTTGFLHASIYDGGDIGFRLAFNRSTLPTFESFVNGTGATLQQVQLLDQSVISLTPEQTLKNGQSLVLVGMSQDTQNEASRASITSYSQSAATTKELQILIITARLMGSSSVPSSSKL